MSEVKNEVAQPTVVWNDANMKSLYTNATNVVAGREEFIMLLGLNQTWQMSSDKVKVDLAERIVMTPFTAKRLAIMLAATVRAYEAKYGNIDVGARTVGDQAPAEKKD